MRFASYDPGDFFDEMFEARGRPRSDARLLIDRLERLSDGELQRRQQAAELALMNMGIPFNVYGSEAGVEKIWPFDIIPRIVAAADWAFIERGLRQRIEALNLFIDDIYHDQKILKDGVLPRFVIESAKGYRQACAGLRPPQGVWCHISGIDLVRDTPRAHALEAPYEYFTEIKMASYLFNGIAQSTMSHGEAWHFGRLGGRLERADQTSRILDVKYFILLPTVEDVGTPFDNIQWSALLKSAGALEMYRKRFGPIGPERVAEFLVLDREFPRSIRYSLIQAERSLYSITGSAEGMFQNPVEQGLGRLRSELDYTRIGEIVASGLHEFLDGVQVRLNGIDRAIFETFFASRPATERTSIAGYA